MRLDNMLSDLWIYNYDKFESFFRKRNLPASFSKVFTGEVYLTSLLFSLYVNRSNLDISVDKLPVVNQVLSRGLELLVFKEDKKPLVFSGLLCGVYEFNNTIAVKLGFKKDGLIKVPKKVFRQLFVERDFVANDYGYVDLVSCPSADVEGKFLDFGLIPTANTLSQKFVSGVIPDCVVFGKKKKARKKARYAFSPIIDLGSVELKKKGNPYIFKLLLMVSRLVLSSSFFTAYGKINHVKSNLFVFKIYKLLKKLLSFLFIFNNLFFKKKCFYVYSGFFNFYLQEFSNIFSSVTSYKKKGLNVINITNFGFKKFLFSGSKLVLSKYRVRSLKDFFLSKHFGYKLYKPICGLEKINQITNYVFSSPNKLKNKLINYYRKSNAIYSAVSIYSNNGSNKYLPATLSKRRIMKALFRRLPRKLLYRNRLFVYKIYSTFRESIRYIYIPNLYELFKGIKRNSFLSAYESSQIISEIKAFVFNLRSNADK